MKTLNPEITNISFKVVVDLPKVEDKSVHPTENSIDSLRERLRNGEIKDITFVDSGSSWGTFGVEVEVDSPALIEPKTKEIYSLMNRILRAEKPVPPAPPKKEDTKVVIYNIYNITEETGFVMCNLMRKTYGSDGRQFDTIHIETNYGIFSNVSKNIRADKHPILEVLSNSPFTYGILQRDFWITFKEGVKLTEDEFREHVKTLTSQELAKRR